MSDYEFTPKPDPISPALESVNMARAVRTARLVDREQKLTTRQRPAKYGGLTTNGQRLVNRLGEPNPVPGTLIANGSNQTGKLAPTFGQGAIMRVGGKNRPPQQKTQSTREGYSLRWEYEVINDINALPNPGDENIPNVFTQERFIEPRSVTANYRLEGGNLILVDSFVKISLYVQSTQRLEIDYTVSNSASVDRIGLNLDAATDEIYEELSNLDFYISENQANGSFPVTPIIPIYVDKDDRIDSNTLTDQISIDRGTTVVTRYLTIFWGINGFELLPFPIWTFNFAWTINSIRTL